MTQIETLEEMLLNAVAARVAEHRFDRRIEQSYYKTYDWGKAAFHLSFIEHDDDFDITADIAIRFDALEELIQKDNKLLSAKEKKNTFSMGSELGNLIDCEPIRWTVISEVDVEEVAKQILQRFENTALPYLEKYCDMEKALKVLSSDEPDAWVHSPFHDSRAKRAVGLAWLMKDHNKVKSLIESKTAFLSKQKDFGLVGFQAFAKSLPN